MTFDALTLTAVRHELEERVLGGQVQQVVLSTELTLGLEIYAQGRRQVLICSAEPSSARVCLAEARPVRESDTPTPFLLLLRKYVRNGRVSRIEQPPYERLLRLTITKRDEQGTPGEVGLIIETMGRRSNVVLVDSDELILEALRRAGRGRNPGRPVLPRHPYIPPSPQDRLNPLDAVSYEKLRAISQENEAATLGDLLVAHMAGFSPLAAREAAFRATGSAKGDVASLDWAALADVVADLLSPISTRRWAPTVAWNADRIAAFAPYRLTHLIDHDPRPMESISMAVEMGFSDLAQTGKEQPSTRALLQKVDAMRTQAERKLAALERSMESAGQSESLRFAAEAVLAHSSSIESGATLFEFEQRQIPLDPAVSALENAQRMFKEYRKSRDAGLNVPEMLHATRLRLQQLEELRALAEVADTPTRQRVIREELAEIVSGKWEVGSGKLPHPALGEAGRSGRKPRPTSLQNRVVKTRTDDGLELLLGVSSRGNEVVTFKLAGPDDLWLHARGVPGAHVILRTGGREPSRDSLVQAARLAARNSQARLSGTVEVDYTSKRNVRKIPAAPPGLVTYIGEKTLSVKPG